ncbi:MAG: glucokinase [Deltaproteobacteria bacterium]|nr:glucokinase [Deltaproteobacteria bacterium]
MSGRILAGDIGGTKTNLALYSIEEGRLNLIAKRSFRSMEYPDFGSLLKEFLLDASGTVTRGCFGVAGPVVGDQAETPNLPWVIDGRKLARSFGLSRVLLINDLEATAYGILNLGPGELVSLNQGLPEQKGNMAVIAAGTGLGEAILFWDGKGHRPFASEGGHADFAPRTALEIELLCYLTAHFGHVSCERVISGPGLWNIYCFLRDSNRFSEPPWLRNRLAAEDPGQVISEVGLAGEADICVKALDLFASAYGAEAGNLALKAKAMRGVYVAGGIAPKIFSKLKDGTFVRAFTEKGRFTDFLSKIPVYLVLNEEAALQGAAYYAAFGDRRVAMSVR